MATTSTRIAALLLAGFTMAVTPAFAQRRSGGGGAHNGGGGRSGAGMQSHAGGGENHSNRSVENRGSENRGVENRGTERFATPRAPGATVAVPRHDIRPNYQGRPYYQTHPNYVVPRAAVPRAAVPRAVVPSYRAYGYRPYYYGYHPYRPYIVRPYGWHSGLGMNFYFGRPYVYGYPTYLYDPGAAYGYYAVAPGHSYGELRIVDAPPNAQVYVDGSYAGVVDDFDGVFQHLNLEAGPHHIEVVAEGLDPYAFDVNVTPGSSVTYHAHF
jgi:hypothetical protein